MPNMQMMGMQQQFRPPMQMHAQARPPQVVNTQEAKQTLDKYTLELKKLDDIINASTNTLDQQRVMALKQKLVNSKKL